MSKTEGWSNLYRMTDSALAEAEASVRSLTVWDLDEKGQPIEGCDPFVDLLDEESAAVVKVALEAVELARMIVARNALPPKFR